MIFHSLILLLKKGEDWVAESNNFLPKKGREWIWMLNAESGTCTERYRRAQSEYGIQPELRLSVGLFNTAQCVLILLAQFLDFQIKFKNVYWNKCWVYNDPQLAPHFSTTAANFCRTQKKQKLAQNRHSSGEFILLQANKCSVACQQNLFLNDVLLEHQWTSSRKALETHYGNWRPRSTNQIDNLPGLMQRGS